MVVASAVALAEAVPDASLRPEGFVLHRGEEVDLGDVAELLVEAGYERTDQVAERGQFAIRGGILDVFPATEERAARLELFGDEIESIRWFSTFTQRSLGEAERIELDPAAELALEHRELAEIASEDGERPDIAELLPIDSFRAPLDLIGNETAVLLAAAEEIGPALHDHWEDVTTAMHDADARHLYVDVAEPLAERALLTVRGPGDADPDPERRAPSDDWRAQLPTSTARSISEAESQLERDLRSNYRIVVAFPSRGEAERARYGLDRIDARFLEQEVPESAAVLFAEAPLAEGFVSPELRLAVIPFRRLVHRRRAAAPTARRAARWRASPSSGSATSSSTPTTGSPASPASRRRRSPASPATTSSSSTAARTRSSRPPTSSPRSAATSAPAPRRRSSPRSARSAGRGSRRGPGAPPASWPASCSTSTPSARPARGTRSPRTASGRSSSKHRFPIARRPTSSTRSRRSRPTWSPSGRWTG